VPSTVTSVVDGLCGRGLVARGTDPADRRRVVLSLTDEGRVQVAEGDRVVAARLGHLLDRLPADQAEGALRGLESLNRAMEDYLEEKFGRPRGSAS
jgi:DNA-binding MarR family transcriptional regulator